MEKGASLRQITPLVTQPRTTENRGQVRRLRTAGLIPASVHGGGESIKISLPQVPFLKELAVQGVYTRIFELEGIGKTLIREIQFPAVKDIPLHVDFLRLIDGSRIVLSVPLRFVHEESSPGLKRGGVINIIHYSLQLSVLAQAIPSEILVDLSGLDIGKTIHLQDIALPEGAKALSMDPNEAVVGVVSPAGLVEELRKGEAGAEEAAPGK